MTPRMIGGIGLGQFHIVELERRAVAVSIHSPDWPLIRDELARRWTAKASHG